MPSTAIQSLSFDDVTKTLFVTFVDGDLYAYFDVPPRVYGSFRSARSKGGFFARNIRGRYRYQKLETGPDLFAADEPSAPDGPAWRPRADAAH